LCTLGLAAFDTHATDLVLSCAAGGFVLGAQHVLNNRTARTYETDLRASGVGMQLGIGRIGAKLGPLLIGALTGGSSATREASSRSQAPPCWQGWRFCSA
jgi:AAHS family 4-hydroxybenzoate transporter-like MFS transporter